MSTPTCMIYGETGKLPLSYYINIRIIGYWLKITNNPNTRINHVLYNVMLSLFNSNKYQSPWLKYVHDLLFSNGLGYVWIEQKNNVNAVYVKGELKERLKLQYIQQWHFTINNSPKCVLYKEIKEHFRLEPYLVKLPRELSRYIVKFRCVNHKFAIEKGRYSNIDRHLRYCDMCEAESLGDEYYLFFVCSNINIANLR